MSVIKKTLFPQNLDSVPVLITDTDLNSKYFKVSELPDAFTGGKNAFLIQGSELLVPDSLLKIEIKDAKGDVIYHEPGEGLISASLNDTPFVTEYYEGTSKVVAVYVYPDTSYGPCTITILGEAKDVSPEWEGNYNVKWQRQVNVNPALANTTKIRFYRRPQVSITELLEPIYRIESGSKVNSGVSQSFADIRISNLETFAGDVKRVKVYRTSLGDISDYDLIQDILIESKELLTTFGLSGSVVTNTGIFSNDTLQKYWNTGSLTATLSNNRIENGVKLNGSGLFRYTSSLNLKNTNTYELNLDAFYSSSTASNLGIYISGSDGGDVLITTLNGISPTKNLSDTIIPFKLDKDFISGSLYFSQSQSEWHLGNISLKLSEDTAFSPDEVSFITSMPTVIGNETFNFKFEFYDVNNNYVPVAVTQSATFDGGTIIGAVDTALIISASFESASSLIYAVSSSISGTAALYLTTSVATSSVFLTASLSTSSLYLTASLNTSSAYRAEAITTASVSASLALSSALSKVQQLADGGFSGSFIGDNVIYSPVLGGQQGYFSQKFQVGNTNPIVLDARSSVRKIYVGGLNDTGSYNSGSTSVYMDSDGKFSLKDKLIWDGTTLTVNGNINLTGGNAQTQLTAVGSATSSLQTQLASVGSATSSLQTQLASVGTATSSLDDRIFTNALGRITKAPTPGSTSGLYLGTAIMGFYNGTAWKTYMDNTGLFYLTGSANGNALLWDGSTLTIKGNLAVGSTVPNSAVTGLGVLATRDTVAATHIDSSAVTNAKIAADAVTEGKIAADAVTSGKISANAVIADKIAANAIVADKIAANAVTAGKIIAGAVEADKIATNAVTADKILANTISAAKISSLEFYGKTAKFDTGDIGGWIINSDKLSSPPDASGYSRLQLNPSPLIAVNDTSGNPRLTIRAGNLSQLGAAGSLSLAFNTINFNSFSDSQSNTGNQFSYGPSYVSFNVANAGTYSGTFSMGATGTVATTPSPWFGYLYVGVGYQIATDASFNNVIAYGIIGSGGIGSAGSVSILASSTEVNITFASTGTHYARLYWQRTLYSSTTAQTTFYSNSSGVSAATLGQSVEVTELTDKGLQIINTTSRYIRIAREGDYTTTPFVVVGGNFAATGNIIAYYSDKRLKNIEGNIPNPLEKIEKINGVYYTQNKLAEEFGYNNYKRQVGLIAQEVEEVLPEVVQQAAFDINTEDGTSKTGENYLSIDYDKVVPLLVECVKELKKEIEELKKSK